MTESRQLYQVDDLAKQIKNWGMQLGFADVGITGTDLAAYEADHFKWLNNGYHGEMHYMAEHGTKRTRPQQLESFTHSIISVRLNYFDDKAENAIQQLQTPQKAYISRYALNRDYHKLMRKRLQKLIDKIQQTVPTARCRAYCDSAPVLERPIAEQAGLGFIGKNSLIIHPRAGSWFFLGEIYTDLSLPTDSEFEKQGCGPCKACIEECPTQAIVDNAVVDARRCISYLTIEYSGIIASELSQKMGNRIYGCDDCQLVCPWNKFTSATKEIGFKTQPILDRSSLLDLLAWDKETFLTKMAGSPIRRIEFEQWQRNLCIAIGNDQYRKENLAALMAVQSQSSVVRHHRDEAINRQQHKHAEHNQIDHCQFQQLGKPAVAPKYYLPKSSKELE